MVKLYGREHKQITSCLLDSKNKELATKVDSRRNRKITDPTDSQVS